MRILNDIRIPRSARSKEAALSDMLIYMVITNYLAVFIWTVFRVAIEPRQPSSLRMVIDVYGLLLRAS